MFTQPFTTKLCTGFGLALVALGLASCGATPTSTEASPIAIATARYFCDTDAQGTYTTFAESAPGQKQAIIRWKSEYFSKSGWTPEQRCNEVSPKFQQAENNNQLNYITNDIQNNLPVVCAAIDQNQRCGLMLFTLRPEEDPEMVRKILIGLALGDAMDPISQSSNSKVYIPMRKVLQNLPFE